MPYTNIEAAQMLKTRMKPYLHIEPAMPQNTFSTTLRNIDLDVAKKSTINSFFPRFGFEGTYDKWEIDADHWFLIAK